MSLLLQNGEHDEGDHGNGQKLDEGGVAQQNDCGDQRERGNGELGESKALLAALLCALLPLKLLKAARVGRGGS